MASSDRTKLKKMFNTRTKGAWKKSREAKAEKTLDVPFGNYIGRITRVIADLDKNDNPYFMIRGTIVHENEEYHGQPFSKSHFIIPPEMKNGKVVKQTATDEETGEKRSWTPKSVEEKLDALAKDLQRCGEDTSDTDIDSLIDICDKLSNEKPFIKIRVQEPYKKGGDPVVWLNGPAKDSDIPDVEITDEEEDEEEETDSEEEETEEEDSEEEESEEEEEDEEETEEEEESEEEVPDDYEEEEEEEEKPKKKPAGKTSTKAPVKKAIKKTTAKAAPAKKKTTKKPALAAGSAVSYKGKPATLKSVAKDGASVVVKMDETNRIYRDVDPADLD